MSEAAVDTAATGDAATTTDQTVDDSTTTRDPLEGVYGADKAKAESEVEEDGTTDEQEGGETDDGAEDTAGDDADKRSEGYEVPLPEGMELDEEGLAAFNELGAKLGITQEQVNELAPFFAERMQRQAESVVDAITTQAEQQTRSWRDESLAADDIGEAGVRIAADAISKFGSAELKAWMDATGAGNHPELIRAFMRVGRAIAEDTLETGDGGGADPADNVNERGIYATQ